MQQYLRKIVKKSNKLKIIIMKQYRITATVDKEKKDEFMKYLKEDYVKVTTFFLKKIDEYIKEKRNDKKK